MERLQRRVDTEQSTVLMQGPIGRASYRNAQYHQET